MNGFDPELREVAGRLELPEPTRSRILLELKGDLAALAESLRAEGVPDPEARRRAMATLLPDVQSLQALRTLHRPLWERLVDRFSEPARHRLERLLLAAMVATLVIGGGITLARLDLLVVRSGFLGPVLGIVASALGLGTWKLVGLNETGAHRAGRLLISYFTSWNAFSRRMRSRRRARPG